MDPINQSEFSQAYNHPDMKIVGGDNSFVRGFNNPKMRVPPSGPVFSPNANALANANPKAGLATKAIGKAAPTPVRLPPIGRSTSSGYMPRK